MIEDDHYQILEDWENFPSPVAAYIQHAGFGELHVLWDEKLATTLKTLIKKYPLDAELICTSAPGIYKRPYFGITLYFVGAKKVGLDILMYAYSHNDSHWLFDDLNEKKIRVNRKTLRKRLEEARVNVLGLNK